MAAMFEFKDLQMAAKNVAFKSDDMLKTFEEQIQKLENAIINKKITAFNSAVKDIQEFLKGVKYQKSVKEFTSKLSSLDMTVKSTRGNKFSAIKLDSDMAVDGEKIGERKMSGSSERGHHEFQRAPERKNLQRLTPDSCKQPSDVEYCCQEVQKLYDKLKIACDKHQKTDESPLLQQGKEEAKDQKKHLQTIIEAADKQVNKLVDLLDMSRGTSKVKEIKQEKHIQIVTDKKEQESKAKLTAITDSLDKLKKQIEDCSYDVTVFQKLKVKDETHDDMNKCKACLTDICMKLKNRNDKEKRQTTEKEKIRNDWEKQCQLIKKILLKLKTDSDDNGNQKEEPTDTTSALKELETKILENKKSLKEFNEMQEHFISEINLLKEEITRFDDETEVTIKGNATKSNILQEIRNVRKALNAKKKEIANDEKNSKSKSTKLRKHVNSLWKIAFNTDMDVANAGGDDGKTHDALQMLNMIVPELEKFEKISFEVEDASEKIHIDVIGAPPFLKDTEELKTPIGVLINVLKTLKSCHAETSLFVVKFSELESAMSIERSNKTISEKCKLMTKDALRWKTENHDMNDILGKCLKLLPMAYSGLISEPYWFSEPHIKMETIEKRYPEWLHNVAYAISNIRGCIKENKDRSVSQKLIQSYSVLSQMYTALTKEDYEDDWKETKTVSQKDKGKSPTPISHVKFVIEDVCRKISRSSADAVGERCRKHIDQLKETNKQLEEEKMTLLTRLSKFAGANLTDNNPNIADLSDPNRPTKLAEEYSELYDNEWTNAYECLQKSKKSEEDIQTILTNIIKEAYSVCGYIGKRQDTVIRSELLSPGDSYSNETLDKGSQTRKKSARQSAPEKSKDTKDKSKGESLSAVQSKTISELRKQTVTSSASNVISYFKTHPQFKEWFATSSLDSYSVRCIKICWLMNIQNPPVYMEKEVKPGSEFDTSKYKSYTKAGKKLAFVVWPALFLHEGGAILTKGVAQGK